MSCFSYKAHDSRSRTETGGSLEAASLAAAVAALKQQGLLPIEVKEVRRRSPATPGGRSPGGRLAWSSGVKSAHVTLFTRQLSTLQDAGLPIVQSLQILCDMQRPGSFQAALQTVTEDVQGGTMLSDALARHPRIWDRLYTNLVKAGESAGALDTILRRLAEFREKAQKLKRKVFGALVYPTAVMSIAVIILTFIMVFIVPRFEAIFRDLNIELPGLTLFLMGGSRMIAGWWYILALVAVAGIIGLRVFRHTAAGGRVIDRAVLHLPVLGTVVKKGAVARFSRTLGTLVSSGVGFLDALDITRSATPNIVVCNAIESVRNSVKEGETIHEPLRRCGVFDDIVVNMIKVGEETGELDRMLIKIADNYDEEVDSAVAAMMALLEPALIVFMGGAVAFIVIALFLPLITIIEDMGKGL